MIHPVCFLLGAAFWAIFAAGPAAQPRPGNVIVLTQTHVLDVVPGGPVTTLTALPAGHDGLGICTSFTNKGVVILTRHFTPAADTSYLLDLQGSVLRTLGSLRGAGSSLPVSAQGGVVRDQRGDYIASSPLGVLRFAGVGGAVRRINRIMATGLTHHLTTGGWMTFGGGHIMHLTRAGQTSKLGSLTGPPIFGAGGVIADTVTGNAFVTFSKLYGFDVSTARFTTLATGYPFGVIRSGATDPKHRTLVLGTSSGVYRVDRTGTLLGTLATFKGGVVGLTVFGSNHVCAFGPSTPGTAWTVLVSFPTDPGLFYQLGAAFSFHPGIPTPAGLISLTPDLLLALVFKMPTIFQRFGGTLDAGGTATASLVIPGSNALRGIRIFLAGLSYDHLGRIRTLSEPVGLTIE